MRQSSESSLSAGRSRTAPSDRRRAALSLATVAAVLLGGLILLGAPAALAAACPGATSCPYTGFARIGTPGASYVGYAHGVAVDGQGDVFVSSERQAILEYSPSGQFARAIGGASLNGGPPATDEQLSTVPGGLTTDANGDVYLADSNNNDVVEFDPAGRLKARYGGSQGSAPGHFSLPTAVAVDASGNIFVADGQSPSLPAPYSSPSRLVELSPSGQVLSTWTSGYNGGKLDHPTGVAIHGSDLYLTCTCDGGSTKTQVQHLDLSGATPSWQTPLDATSGAPTFYSAQSVAVDDAGAVYLDNGSTLARFSAGTWTTTPVDSASASGLATHGTSLYRATGQTNGPSDTDSVKVYDAATLLPQRRIGQAGNGELLAPQGGAVDSAGNLYVADSGMNRVQKFDPSGAWLATWGRNGGDGSPGSGGSTTTPAEFDDPVGVAVDGAGGVWVADYGNHRIVKLDTSGNYISEIDTGGENPWAIAADASKVYVSNGSHTIAAFPLSATGTATPTWTYLDTTGSEFPYGLASDGTDLYIATGQAAAIRRLKTADGTVDGSPWTTSASGAFLRGVALVGGSVYASDTGGTAVRKWNPVTGSELTSGEFGGRDTTPIHCPGTLSFPVGLAAGSGTLFAFDDNSVAKFQFSGGTPPACDTNAPSPSITSPGSGGPTVGSSPSFAGAAGQRPIDAATVHVLVYASTTSSTYAPVADSLVASVQSDGTWSVPADRTLPDGNYHAVVTQRDSRGVIGTGASPVLFTVSGSGGGATTPPAPTITSPASGTSTLVNAPTISGTAGTRTGTPTDATTVELVVRHNGTIVSDLTNVPVSGGHWSAQVPASAPLPNGSNTLEVLQRDSANDLGSSPAGYALTIVAPTITAPNGSTVTRGGSPLHVTGSAATYSGSTGTVTVALVPAAGGTPAATLNAPVSGGNWSADVPLSTLAEGTYVVQATQSDSGAATGTAGQGTSTDGPSIQIVKTAPTVIQSQPPDGHNYLVNGGSLDLTLHGSVLMHGPPAASPLTVELRVQDPTTGAWGTPTFLTATVSGSGWSIVHSFTPGRYFTRAYGTDAAGNRGYSSGAVFGVISDHTAPLVTLSAPGDLGYLGGRDATMSGTAGTLPADGNTNESGDLPAVSLILGRWNGNSWQYVRTLTADGVSGRWTTSFPGDLSDGLYEVEASQSDRAGNTASSPWSRFTVKRQGPALGAGGLTITTPDYNTTSQSPLQIGGTAGTADGDNGYVTLNVVRINSDGSRPAAGGSPLTVPVTGGRWSATATLPPGDWYATASQGDAAGNSSLTQAQVFSVAAPPPPSSGGSSGGGVGSAAGATGNGHGAAAGCQGSLDLGPFHAEGECLQRVGLTWISKGSVSFLGLKLVPNGADAEVVLDPLNLRVAAHGNVDVQLGPFRGLGPITLYHGHFDWVWQGHLSMPNGLGFGAPSDWNAPPVQLPSEIGSLGLPSLPSVQLPDLSKLTDSQLGQALSSDALAALNGNGSGVSLPTSLLGGHANLPPLCFATGQDASLFGFPLSGNVCLKPNGDGMQVSGNLALPSSFGGATADAAITVHRDGSFSVDDLGASVPDVWLGPMHVTDTHFAYRQADNSWAGGTTATLPVINAGIGADVLFKNGHLRNLHVQGDFGNSLQPLPGVFLNRIAGGVDTEPDFVIRGGMRVTVGPTVGGCAALSLGAAMSYDATRSVFKLDAGPNNGLGSAFDGLDLACVHVGDAHFEVDGNGTVSGSLALKTPSIAGFSASAHVKGWVSPDNFSFDGGATIKTPWPLPGGSASAAVSGNGIGICLGSVGLGHRWGQSWYPIWGGCDVGEFTIPHPAHDWTAAGLAHTAAAGAAVTLPAGLPKAVLAFTGTAGPPAVMIREPNGRTITTPAAADTGAKGDDWLAYAYGADRTTYVILARPAAGTYAYAARPGSAISAVKVADGLPAAQITASVSGAGTRRVVSWKLTPEPGRRFTLVERAGDVAHTLGVASSATGSLTFTPASGVASLRRVVAQVTQNGLPVAELPLTSFRAPSSGPGRPTGLHLVRRGTTLIVRWGAAGGARAYLVRVASAGRVVERTARALAATVAGIDERTAAAVTVRAIGIGSRFGPAAAAQSTRPTLPHARTYRPGKRRATGAHPRKPKAKHASDPSAGRLSAAPAGALPSTAPPPPAPGPLAGAPQHRPGGHR